MCDCVCEICFVIFGLLFWDMYVRCVDFVCEFDDVVCDVMVCIDVCVIVYVNAFVMF